MLTMQFYRHLQTFFTLLAIGIVIGIAVFASTIEIKDLDLWFHMRSGQYIFHQRSVPSVDVFSATAQGKYWNNHEWLFQLIVFGLKRLWSMNALIYMQAGIVLLTFLSLLLLTFKKSKQILIPPLLYIVYQVYQTRFTIRPDIFSILFLIIFIAILTTSLKKRWSLWVLFFLQALWVNIHGYFFLGIAIVLIYLMSEWLRRTLPLPSIWKQEGALAQEEFVRLHWILFALMGATFINPQGIKGAVYPLLILGNIPSAEGQIFFKYITELQKPILKETWWHLQIHFPYKVSIILSGLALCLSWRRLEIRWLVMWAFFLLFSMIALRNMTYFAVISYVITMFAVLKIDIEKISPIRFVSEKMMLLTGSFLLILMCFIQINHANDLSVRGYYDFKTHERKSLWLGVDQRMFPHQAVDFLKQERVKGNFFNDFNSGAYLIGRVYPRIKVFIDGRTELRGGDFFELYRKIWEDGDEKLLDDVIERYQLTGAFINTAQQLPGKVVKVFFKKKDWYLVYLDYDAAIFLKDVPEHEKTIDKYTIDFSTWKPYALDIIKFGSTRAIPYQFLHRARLLKEIGLEDLALQECDAALAAYPAFADIYGLKGHIYEQRKDVEKSFLNYRLALSFDYSMEWYIKLTRMYYAKGHYDEVIKRIEKIQNDVKMSSQIQLLLAKSFAKKKQNAQAYDILMNVLRKPLMPVGDLVDLADIFLENQHQSLAQKCYKIALKKNPRSKKARRRLGDFFQRRKDQVSADMISKKGFKKVLSEHSK